jgi:sarcosine oxidase subunit alpha
MDRRIYDSPHRRYTRGKPITIEFEKQTYRAFEGEPVAVALFAAGVKVLSRSQKYHRPRGFFCLAGHCNGCLMRADGLPNTRGCLTACADGQVLEGQNAFPAADLDVLGIVDWIYREGMDHHTLMTGSRLLNAVMQKVVRQLSGLGKVPDHGAPSLPEVTSRAVDVAVIGGGAAGLAAAQAAARGGADTILIDEQDVPGGSLLADPRFGPDDAARRADQARAAGATIVSRATAISWFPEDDGGLLAVATPTGLVRLTAKRYVYATGAYDANGLFEDNDRPGVFSARAVGRLAVRWGVRPGTQIVVVGDDAYARALTQELASLGVEATRVDGTSEKITRARGHSWVEGVDTIDARGKKRKLACDAVAVSALPSPASEAPRQHGCRVELDAAKGGYAVIVDPAGHTSTAGVLACGDVTGFVGPEVAATHGAKIGVLAAEEAERG